MIYHSIKSAIRNLKKNMGFTVMNVLGLSIGLAACLLIVMFVQDELSYDKFNDKADRIYRVTIKAKLNGHEGSYATSEGPMEAALQQGFPEIEKVTRLIDKNGLAVSAQKFSIQKGAENIHEKNVVYTESSLFDVFTLPMIQGNSKQLLDEPNTAVITESAARKYFNRTDVVGKVLTINDTSLYKITGVMKDIPANAHFHYDFFLSFSSLPESHWQGWGYSGVHNYLLLKPGTDPVAVATRIRELQLRNSSAPAAVWNSNGNYLQTILTPLTDIHLRSDSEYELENGGNIEYVYIFSFIAVIILLIACINFMNLSTARSAYRAKEVGVRKVLGSSRIYVAMRFLTESILLTLIAAGIAILLAVGMMPLFNQVSGKELHFSAHFFGWLAPNLLVIVLIVGLVAGMYPAWILSGFKPIEVLKGRTTTGPKGGFLRSSLVVFQFFISITLIISTLVIYNQLNYIRHKDLGFDRSHVLVIKNTDRLGNKATILKSRLEELPGVLSATMSSYQPTGDQRLKTGLFPDRTIDIKNDVLSEFWKVDEHYLSTMGMSLIQGRNFSKELASDSSAIIVNEAFAAKFGWKDPLGKVVYRNSFGIESFHVVGVVRDFHFESLKDAIGPVALVYGPDNGAVSVRVRTADLGGLIGKIEDQWKEVSPNQQFSYSFMDADFDATYRSEQRLVTLLLTFSILAIAVACLGLFGLTAYEAERRTKEIGIRKVLGASTSGIVGMLSGDFIRLIGIAILIASPVAWYGMNKWLQHFAYRIDISWWVMIAAGMTAILIALATISFQSVKAALANPVESLRNE